MCTYHSSQFMRIIGVGVASALFFNASASGLGAMSSAMSTILSQSSVPGPFLDTPGPVHKGSNPGRDPKGRGGVWKQEHTELLELGSRGTIYALQGGGGGQDTGFDEGSGGGFSWEGGGTGGVTGASSVNTNNGNKLTTIPLVSWQIRGGMILDFTLYHNSISTYQGQIGHSWSFTQNVYINQDSLTGTATVKWGDGQAVPFDSGTNGFVAPAGVYDTLVKNTNSTWTLTKKHGTIYGFNTAGFLTSITDRAGNAITITRNSNHYVTKVSDPTGREIIVNLDSNNRITSIEDPLGRVWTFTRDTNDDLDKITYPVLNNTTYSEDFDYNLTHDITSHWDRRGKEWKSTYNGDGSLATETTPLGYVTSYTYNSTNTVITRPQSRTETHNFSNGKLVSKVDAASYSDAREYDTNNNVTKYTTKRGKIYLYTYDSRGNRITEKNPLNKTWTYTYSTANELLSEEDPLGNKTEYTYNSAGKLLTVKDPLLRTTVTNTYDGYGQLASTKNALNETTTFNRSGSHGYLTSVVDPLNKTTTITFDLLGRVTSVQDPNNNTESISYDVWGRPTTFTHPGSVTSSRTYNENGQLLTSTNERSKTTTFGYDDDGRKTSVTNAKSETEVYTYNSLNELTKVTNGRGKERNYTYTTRSEPYSLTMPDGAYERWHYSAEGFVAGYTNPLSQTIYYRRDDASRPLGVDYPVGTDTTISYDNADRATQMVDSVGTTTWTYNAASELTALSTPQGNMSYTYYASGRRNTMVETGVGTTTYSYDAAGRLTSLQNPHSETTGFQYDDGGRLTRKTFHNGAYTAYVYDSRNRPTNVNHRTSSNGVISSDTNTYDDAGNLLTRNLNGVTTTFGYDDIDQLTSESRTGYSASYTYDANGNRTSKTLGGVTDTYIVDDADKLTSITRNGTTIKSYGYDAGGRTTSVVTSAGTTTLAYDYSDRITGITYPNSSTNTFTYNGLDSRVGKVDSSGTFTYKRDGAYVTDPVLSDGGANYTPATSEKRGGTTSHYMHDRMGTLNRVINSAQTNTHTRAYDAFGMLTSSAGTSATPFGYAGAWGYQEDGDSGLKLLGHRYYDASTGRFLTRDKIKEGRNWYLYCANQPQRLVDPTGLITIAGFEFTGETVGHGLTTGLHGAASGFTFGLYDGGDYREETGFGVSQTLGSISAVSAIGAGGVAVAPRAVLVTTQNGLTLENLGNAAVIGNNMGRVSAAAGAFRLATFEPSTPSRIGGFFQNMAWIIRQVFSQNSIVDIGPVPGQRPYGPYYIMERLVTRFLCTTD
jgi:RHS repeat-associated protein